MPRAKSAPALISVRLSVNINGDGSAPTAPANAAEENGPRNRPEMVKKIKGSGTWN